MRAGVSAIWLSPDPSCSVGPCSELPQGEGSQTGVSPVGPPQWSGLELIYKERLHEWACSAGGGKAVGTQQAPFPPTKRQWGDGNRLLREMGGGEREAQGGNGNREDLI